MAARRTSFSAWARRAARPVSSESSGTLLVQLLGGQVAAETVGEGCGVLGDGADDGGVAARLDDDAAGRVHQPRPRRDLGRPLAERHLGVEQGDRLARGHQALHPLLGELEEGLHRPHHEHRVADEGHQLAHAEASLDQLVGAQPDQGDQQHPGQQHADRLRHRLPGAGRHAEPPDALRLGDVVVAEGPLAADAAQDAQSGDDVGGHRGELAGLGALGGLGRVQRTQHRRRGSHQQRRGDHHDPAQRRRGAEHQAADHDEGCERPDGAGQHLEGLAEGVRVRGGDAEHLTRRQSPTQHVSELDGLAGDQFHGAVHRDQPGADDQRVLGDARGSADQDDNGQQSRPAKAGPEVAAQDAVVDGPSQQERAERARHEPQQACDRHGHDHVPLHPEQPEQEPARATGVRA